MHEIFRQIQIMTRHECNLKCAFCPNSYREQTKYEMPHLLFSKILDELSEINYDGRITPYLMNEPFLDKRLPVLIKEAREKCQNATIDICTNGIIPTHKDMKKLFDIGLNNADISCYNQETYEKWLDVDRLHLVRISNQSPHLNNRGGNSPNFGFPINHGYCERPFEQMYINAWGEAILCCSDYKRIVVLGDVNTTSLVEIWNNDLYNEYRQALQAGMRTLPLCLDCNYITQRP